VAAIIVNLLSVSILSTGPTSGSVDCVSGSSRGRKRVVGHVTLSHVAVREIQHGGGGFAGSVVFPLPVAATLGRRVT